MSGGFDDLGLMPELIRSINEMGWNLPTDVQDEAIPLILTGGDVMVAAETGSGKTAAFCLPTIQCVHERLRAKANAPEVTTDQTTSVVTSISSLAVKLNLNDRDPFCDVLDGGDACASANKNAWMGIRATHGVRSGTYYYQCTIKGDGICRLGWSTAAASFNLGTDAHGFGYGGTAKKSTGGAFIDYGQTYKNGDVITSCIDLSLQPATISYVLNGKYLGIAFELPRTHANSTFYPAFAMKCGGMSVDFQTSVDWSQITQLPSGFSTSKFHPLNTASGNDVVSSVGVESESTQSSSSGQSTRRPMAIIIEPSRELAEQVYNETVKLLQYVREPKLTAVLITGGSEGNELKKLMNTIKAGVDIVIGTPGKIQDLVSRKVLSLSSIQHFILDEADRFTADAENLKTILGLYQMCGSRSVAAATTSSSNSATERLQVCFFSATLHSPDITSLSEQICVRPTWVDLKGVDSVPESVHHVIYRVDLINDLHYLSNAHGSTSIQRPTHGQYCASITDGMHKSIMNVGKFDSKHNNSSNSSMEVESTSSTSSTFTSTSGGLPPAVVYNEQELDHRSQLVKELKQQILLRIIDKFQMSQCMIFCRTNVDCNNLEQFLIAVGGGQKFNARSETGKENPYSCCVLAGMRSNDERKQSLEAFKESRVRFLICTDVAARGIDIKSLPYVINMTLPDVTEVESYIHRIGRVGRADKVGLACSIVTPLECNEKVWYHSNCNKKVNCMNRTLLSAGGCAKWHTENDTVRAIEQRLVSVLPAGLPSLTPITFDLPECYRKLHQIYGETSTASGEGVAHGNVQQNQRIANNTNKVLELRQLEVDVSRDFFLTKAKYDQCCSEPNAKRSKL